MNTVRNLVTLTKPERTMLIWVGEQRYEWAREHFCDPGKGPSAQWSGPENHIRGACCEFACSLALNLYWRPHIGELHKPDVGGFIQVRSTPGRLFVKPKDAGPHVLVQQLSDLDYQLAGWMDAAYAQVGWPLTTGKTDAAHVVPAAKLWALDLLGKAIVRVP